MAQPLLPQLVVGVEMAQMTQEKWNKEGYAKKGLTKERVQAVHTRTMDPSTGKVYRGEAGNQLRAKQLNKQTGQQRRQENKRSVIGLR